MTAIFLKWWGNIFIPYLMNKRRKYNYFGPAIVIADGLKAHHAVLDYYNNVQNIIRIVSAIYRSIDPYSTASAFRQAGIILELSEDRSQKAKVCRGSARGVRHYSPERLSTEENKTPAQQKADNSRINWGNIHKKSYRIII